MPDITSGRFESNIHFMYTTNGFIYKSNNFLLSWAYYSNELIKKGAGKMDVMLKDLGR